VPYKVFFVEDEIEIREGIRDNVEWTAYGFQFCGEAPDGELALPLIQAARPDLLITDIRMPFMDGLQLSQIVRERLPGTRIIILSGHDEFEYAQKAVKLGVFEYLLKPVSLQDLHHALEKVALELERERDEQQALQRLRDQVEQNRAALRERFLLRLVTGVASAAETIQQAHQLGLDLMAQSYLVVAIRIETDASQPPDPLRLRPMQELASGLVDNNPDAFLLRKDLRELLILLKGTSEGSLLEERDLLLARMRQAAEETQCELFVGSGTPQRRIIEIDRSFLQASDMLQAAANGRNGGSSSGFEEAGLLQVDRSMVEDYLRSGTVEEFDRFFESFSRPLGERALTSSVAKNYVFTDIVLATAHFIDGMGGNADQLLPELGNLETILAGIETLEHLRDRARRVLAAALAFRDNSVTHHYAEVIKRAQECMERRYMDPQLSLNEVAAHVNLSAGHFSTVFSQETGHTFKEYLTEVRIKRAKELLRTTTLKAFEICDQVGYNDPHYFSHVFHKHTGLTPMEFRMQVQAG
jgi:two-component system, response regulator YesN